MNMSDLKVTAEEVEQATAHLEIPSDDDGGDDGDHTSSVLSGRGPITIRRPDRRDWIIVNRAAAIRVRLAAIPVDGQFEPEWYYVPQGEIRDALAKELKLFTVVPYYSTLKKRFHLYPFGLGGDSSWADSLHVLFNQAPDWYPRHQVRIVSSREDSRYIVHFRAATAKPVFPIESTNALLGEALGPGRIIDSCEHPRYQKVANIGEVLI